MFIAVYPNSDLIVGFFLEKIEAIIGVLISFQAHCVRGWNVIISEVTISKFLCNSPFGP